MVATPVNKTTKSTKMAIEMNVGPNRSAWATSARAMTAPESIARKMFTRPSDSV